ncbi:MAG: hypothetical protein CML02_20625 [Pseudooceanicola sp.]|jgi:OOP family OmpA-OmpF porin|nr:hypothetical protein [Pseudooceanicola sp.]
MRFTKVFIVLATFALAACACLAAAGVMATGVERTTEIEVRTALDTQGNDWAEVQADGLRVILTGTAPTEARRFQAISRAGQIVDAARVIDQTDVAPTQDIAPPRFSAEILRNESGLSVSGLIPTSTDRAALIERLEKIAAPGQVSDLLQTANHPVPDGWDAAIDFTITALRDLPRSKISVDAGRIEITAIAASREEKAKMERALNRAVPEGLKMALQVSAPRPVITPFTLRYIIDDTGGRFDACSADTEQARARILAAAAGAGGQAGAQCRIGLGVPSPAWAEAVAQALAALRDLGAGSVTFADADVTLVAAETVSTETFDRVVGELEAALPPVFSLHPVLTRPAEAGTDGPPEFTATLSPEGLVQLRGRLSDDNLQMMADAYARARFGASAVHSAARTADNLPSDWPVRVLAGLEALSQLSNGAVTVTPDALTLHGTATREDAQADIAGLLAKRLGEAETFDLSIAYKAPPLPQAEIVTPEMCEAEIAEVQRTSGKITFEPGSATIAAESLDTMNAIAEILDICGDIRVEIQGHTDSQGRESMNQQLSQDRAQSVLNELRARRILTASYTARGYGEANPIATNKTEDGREANRRIEFRLIRPQTTPERTSTLDAVAQQLQSDSTDDAAASDDAPETGSEDEATEGAASE